MDIFKMLVEGAPEEGKFPTFAVGVVETVTDEADASGETREHEIVELFPRGKDYEARKRAQELSVCDGDRSPLGVVDLVFNGRFTESSTTTRVEYRRRQYEQ